MQLTKEAVDAYTEIVTNPTKHGFTFTPVNQFFEKSDIVTPKHILAKAYIDHVEKPLPKVILYIIMDNLFGVCDGKATTGELGYHLKVKEKPAPAVVDEKCYCMTCKWEGTDLDLIEPEAGMFAACPVCKSTEIVYR